MMRIFRNRTKERFLKKVIRKAEQLLRSNDVNKKPYTVIKYLMLHYYVKALKLAKGIVAVSKENLDSDAKILFRSLFEIGCYCEYILIDPGDIKRTENCIAISWIEDKKTADNIKKYGHVNVDNIPILSTEKEKLRDRIRKTEETRSVNYESMMRKLRERNHQYKKLSDRDIIAKEKLTLGKVIEEVNEIYNKETEEENPFLKYYVFGFRLFSKAVHNTDFVNNVRLMDDGRLEYYLNGKESTTQMTLGAAATFLFRIVDIASEMLEFKKDNTLIDLLSELKILQDK